MTSKVKQVHTSVKGVNGFLGIAKPNPVYPVTPATTSELPFNPDYNTAGIEDASIAGLPAIVKTSYTHINPGSGKGPISVPFMPESTGALTGAKLKQVK